MRLGILFQNPIANVQSRTVQLVKMVDTVAHIHSNLFPREKAQIPLYLSNPLRTLIYQDFPQIECSNLM